MPTGVALGDARGTLFDAAEHVLLRDGANALTSRAVTAEAGVAKGVLHRYFADFDAFLTELVRDRVERMGARSAELADAAGTGTVAGNLADAMPALFGPIALRIVGLVVARDGLRARLRAAGLTGMPVLTQAAGLVAAYLAAERDRGRIAPDADVDTLAATLIGAGHLLFAGGEGGPPEPGAVRKVVATVVAGAVREPAS